MIRVMIFDLDGTLVKMEVLNALFYARAVQDLYPAAIPEVMCSKSAQFL